MTDPVFLTPDEVLGIHADPDALYELVDGVAAGAVDKAEVSVFLRRNCGAR